MSGPGPNLAAIHSLAVQNCRAALMPPASRLAETVSLQAFMAATQEENHLLGPKEVVEAWHAKTDALTEEINALKKKRTWS